MKRLALSLRPLASSPLRPAIHQPLHLSHPGLIALSYPSTSPSSCDNLPGPPPTPWVALTDSVNPTVVHAGNRFAAFATAGFLCGGQPGAIVVTCASETYAQSFSGSFGALTDTLTAVLGD